MHDGFPQHAYGWPLIPWFALAWANFRLLPSVVSFFTLGLILGLAQPRRWWLVAFFAIVVPPILLSINIVHDWAHDNTSHNLFPFEFAIYGFLCAPAIIGALLGFLFRRRRMSTAQTCTD
jgi:hypothetical protein